MRILFISLTLFCLAIIVSCSKAGELQKAETKNPKESNLKSYLIFWNIGQGDMMTYISPRRCIFFDLGGNQNLNRPSLNVLRDNCFLKNNILFISHYDKDHIVKYKLINQLLNFNKVYVPHFSPQTKTGINFINYFKRAGVKVEICNLNFKINYDGFKIKLLNHNHDKTENSKSLLLLLSKNKKTILLTGDLQSKFEPQQNTSIDILKVAHHGSKHSSSISFIESSKPKTCIISVGKNNYGHPAKEVLKRLQNAGCSVLRTDILGNIRMSFSN